MATTAASVADMLQQLESARKLALSDPQVYSQVIPGILPIIGVTAPLEVRRWGADFLAEGFATPSLTSKSKEELVIDVVPVLKSMLENPNQDGAVVRSAVQAAASVYGLVFRRIITQPEQVLLWNDMTAIKLNILHRMDNTSPSVRICCIKFVQKVVQVQTPGLIADPRRPDHNETSLALVPRNHPLLPGPSIEAETSGLLDRLLSVLQEQSGDPLLVDATLNCLAVLIRTRPAVANKILSAILNYNPFRHASMPMTPKKLVIIKSLERTARALLRNVLKTHPNHPMEPKMKIYLDRLAQSRAGLLAEVQSLKRPADGDEGPEGAKRQRLAQGPKSFPPMPPPPNSYAQLFTLTQDAGLQNFDVTQLHSDMVSNVAGLLLQHIDQQSLDEAIGAVRSRYAALQKATQLAQSSRLPMAGPTGIDDEDDYDPEFVSESAEAAIERATEKALEELAQPMIELGPFELPKPSPLSSTEVALLSDQTVARVFEIAASFERVPATSRQKSGLNRLAAANNDKDAWITILTRLATRASEGLTEYVTELEARSSNLSPHKKELSQPTDTVDSEQPNMANRIRQTLFHYILDDWRSRINIAISWLTEEWYTDRLATKPTASAQSISPSDDNLLPNYTRMLHRLLEQLLPRFDASDTKLLIRFLSELPHLNADILDQVRQLAKDPGTVKICTLSLQYLVMFRPPVREMVLDTLEDIFLEGDIGVKETVRKVLLKWRPGFESGSQLDVTKQEGTTKFESDNASSFPMSASTTIITKTEEAQPLHHVDVRTHVNGNGNLQNPPDTVVTAGSASTNSTTEETASATMGGSMVGIEDTNNGDDGGGGGGEGDESGQESKDISMNTGHSPTSTTPTTPGLASRTAELGVGST